MIATLAAKELRILFFTPFAWVVLALLQLIMAWVFLVRLDEFLNIQPQYAQLLNPPGVTELIVAPLCAATAILFMAVTPIFAMRLVAEERRQRTFSLLLSSPLSMTEIVLGKFLGLLCFLGLGIVLCALLAVSLAAGGPLDWGMIATNLLGLLGVAASFAAICLYASCLTAHPALAAFIALALLLGSWLTQLASGTVAGLAYWLSPLKHFENFNKGLIDSTDIAYFCIYAVLFLWLATRRLNRYRQGQ
ncbi:MAG: ABC transporter permease subunit [Pseudomonadota bacterium]